MADKASEDSQPKKVPTFTVHSGEEGYKPKPSSEEEKIVEEFSAEEIPVDEKKRSIEEREAAFEFLEKTTASELQKVEGAFEEIDDLMEEYNKIKGMVEGITKNHPHLKKYL
tara:strand:+ start:772 stop:1107 length:336 start_codon:yes stop_codon:yes gene_type:complete